MHTWRAKNIIYSIVTLTTVLLYIYSFLVKLFNILLLLLTLDSSFLSHLDVLAWKVCHNGLNIHLLESGMSSVGSKVSFPVALTTRSLGIGARLL